MGSDVLATRQGQFVGAGVDVEIVEGGVDFKAVILQEVDTPIIYIKTKMDPAGECTMIENDDLAQVSRVVDAIWLNDDTIKVDSSIATDTDSFTWLALIN